MFRSLDPFDFHHDNFARNNLCNKIIGSGSLTFFIKGKPAMGSCQDRVARATREVATCLALFSRRTYRSLCVLRADSRGIANARSVRIPLSAAAHNRDASPKTEAYCWALIGVRNPRQYLAFSSPPLPLPRSTSIDPRIDKHTRPRSSYLHSYLLIYSLSSAVRSITKKLNVTQQFNVATLSLD